MFMSDNKLCGLALPAFIGFLALQIPSDAKTVPKRVVFGKEIRRDVRGLLEVNFPDSEMATGELNAGLMVNAKAAATSRAVNGAWFSCYDKLDSCLGISN